MSISREVTVWCDNCGEWDQSAEGARRLRRDLKRKGWVHKAGKDLCPRCADPKPRELTETDP